MSTTERAVFFVGVAVLALIVMAGFAAAQEAVKPPDVVTLESIPRETPQIAKLKKAIEAEIDAYSGRAVEMNDWMFKNPESAHLELQASTMMGDELKKQGFDVTYGVPGLTKEFESFVSKRYGGPALRQAFVAKYKGGQQHPVVGFLLEADALRAEKGPFHGCQHNQQGPVALAQAIALSRIMEQNKIPGSVWVIFTPAEETPPPVKAAMTHAGIFDEVDFIVRSHGTPNQARRAKAGLGNCCMLIEASLYEFTGSPSHGTRAWQGRDALDAARVFFGAVDMLREHSEPVFRFMGTITRAGTAPNVTNYSVEVDHWVRNDDRSGIAAIRKKLAQVDTIAKAAAMATFTEVEIQHYGSDYNGIENGLLQALAWQYTKEYGDATAMSEELDEPAGWDEAGVGAVNVPGVSIRPAVAGIPDVAGHSYENADVSVSPSGHKGLIQTAKIGAAVALRLVMDADLRTKVTNEHNAWQRYGLAKGLIVEDSVRKKAPTTAQAR